MRLLELASAKSFWRGLDYHHLNKVKYWKKIDRYKYESEVIGSNHEIYHVMIDVDHPKRSTCDCPFAKGRHVICKHMVATYFSVFEDAETIMMKRIEDAQNEYENQKQLEFDKRKNLIAQYVRGLSKKELQALLLDILVADAENEIFNERF